MAPQLPRNTHSIQVPNDDGTVNATGGEEVALAVEAQACCMARTNGVGDIFGIVL